MKMTILRGVSGSGKSTYARTIDSRPYVGEQMYQHEYDALLRAHKPPVICSADDHFMVDGEYKFDPAQLGEAHRACFVKADEALAEGRNVVIDNTNTQLWEISPYMMLAQKHRAEVRITRLTCPASVACSRNVHGVPEKAIEAMEDRMEALPPFWPQELIHSTDNPGEED